MSYVAVPSPFSAPWTLEAGCPSGKVDESPLVLIVLTIPVARLVEMMISKPSLSSLSEPLSWSYRRPDRLFDFGSLMKNFIRAALFFTFYRVGVPDFSSGSFWLLPLTSLRHPIS